MPVQLPILDDRRWDDLVLEGRSLYAQHAPGVDDHNLHDPGITQLEMFAWLTETAIFQLDQIPEEHIRKFLKLLGYPPSKALATRGILHFDWPLGSGSSVLPSGSAFETAHDGVNLPVRTLDELTITDTQLQQLLVETVSIEDVTPQYVDRLSIQPFGPDPDKECALYLGLSHSPDTLSVGFRLAASATGYSERTKLEVEARKREELCRRIVPDIDCGAAEAPEDEHRVLRHHSVNLVWEVYTGRNGGSWVPLENVDRYGIALEKAQVRDGTRDMSLDGIVEVKAPDDAISTTLDDATVPHFYVRARVAGGQYEVPPRLADVRLNCVWAEQSIRESHEFVVEPGAVITGTAPPVHDATKITPSVSVGGKIAAIQFGSTVDADPEFELLAYRAPTAVAPGRVALALAFLGIGTGAPSQVFELGDGDFPEAALALQEGTLRVHSLSVSGEWRTWNVRRDLDAAAHSDYFVESNGRYLRFGDGERGRVLAKDDRVFIELQRTGGGAGAIERTSGLRVADSPFNAALAPSLADLLNDHGSVFAAFQGGADEESVGDATTRLLRDFHAGEQLRRLVTLDEPSLDQVDRTAVLDVEPPYRASTLAEVERLVLSTPGARIARAKAWPNRHSRFQCICTPGVVMVVIVPDTDSGKPVPSEGFIKSVQRFLECRRIVTMKVDVTAPTYTEVSIHARIEASDFVDPNRVREAVVESIDLFLDPRKGGEDGRGWPFGRGVYRSEILQRILNIDGVEGVLDLSLRENGSVVPCGNLEICDTSLVYAGPHVIGVE